jgi:hypothetical protein
MWKMQEVHLGGLRVSTGKIKVTKLPILQRQDHTIRINFQTVMKTEFKPVRLNYKKIAILSDISYPLSLNPVNYNGIRFPEERKAGLHSP